VAEAAVVVEGVVAEEMAWVLAVVVEAVEEVVVAVEAVVPTSVDRLTRRKAERRLKHQRESLYPRSVGDHYCG